MALPDFSRPLVTANGVIASVYRTFFLRLNNLFILTGKGSPEGIVSASTGQMYMDTIGVSGAILYIKRDAAIAGDATQGWVKV